ncbi:hypothetical protein SERLA73DRAFT_68214 [Serpula lacrymans var. lacrymans S7.3]|uniref:Uncharacterized protein n=1 Tax=Serpula lacrymans var. lacrymans (strain S7.3) TaxID=936435 RepID=F8PHJ6_SERL3|nr:hypothetical protein SERLA73DRAFT_68214 [Serpula lacrymans var. lacrymans S7.3]
MASNHPIKDAGRDGCDICFQHLKGHTEEARDISMSMAGQGTVKPLSPIPS